jgi:hypothetical protein
LLYRTTENALTEPAEVDAVPSGDRVDPWNEALEHRLEQEREFVLDSVGEALGKYVAKVNAERDAQVNEEFAKIWRSLTMALKQITKIQREKVERAFRTEAIDPNAKMN